MSDQSGRTATPECCAYRPDPESDDRERMECVRVGQMGHQSCGTWPCGCPRFIACPARVATGSQPSTHAPDVSALPDAASGRGTSPKDDIEVAMTPSMSGRTATPGAEVCPHCGLRAARVVHSCNWTTRYPSGRGTARAERCEACGKFSSDMATITVRSHFDLPAPRWCARCREAKR